MVEEWLMISMEVMVIVKIIMPVVMPMANIDKWKFRILFSEWGMNITVMRSLPFVRKRCHRSFDFSERVLECSAMNSLRFCCRSFKFDSLNGLSFIFELNAFPRIVLFGFGNQFINNINVKYKMIY